MKHSADTTDASEIGIFFACKHIISIEHCYAAYHVVKTVMYFLNIPSVATASELYRRTAVSRSKLRLLTAKSS